MSGQHQWTVVGVWALTEEDAAAFVSGKPDVNIALTGRNLLTVDGPGCYRCEQMYRDAKGTECPSTEPPLERDVKNVTRLGVTEHIGFGQR